MTRDEYLAWAKERAFQYADAGQLAEAMNSITSDLGKHPGTTGHPAIETMTILADGGHFTGPRQLRRFIEGIH